MSVLPGGLQFNVIPHFPLKMVTPRRREPAFCFQTKLCSQLSTLALPETSFPYPFLYQSFEKMDNGNYQYEITRVEKSSSSLIWSMQNKSVWVFLKITFFFLFFVLNEYNIHK